MTPDKATKRLVKLCGLLGSSAAGERANAAALADAYVREMGLTWADVIKVAQPETGLPDWQLMTVECLRYPAFFDLQDNIFLETCIGAVARRATSR